MSKYLPKVSIVIVNHNKKFFILECLQSVFNLAYPNFEVIVVDNGSNDGSVEAIKELKNGNFFLIQNERNLGGSAGFNTGIRRALNNNSKYIWLLDNDVIVHKDALINLVRLLEENQAIGACGSKIYLKDNPNYIWSAGGKFIAWRGKTFHFSGYEIENPSFNKIKEVDYSPSCSLLIRKELILKVGLMDEKFFIYGDDVDLCMRIKKAEYRIFYQPSSIVWHKVSQSINSPFSIYYSTRNKIYLMRKYTKAFEKFYAYPYAILRFLSSFINLIKKNKFKKQNLQIIISICRGFIDGWRI